MHSPASRGWAAKCHSLIPFACTPETVSRHVEGPWRFGDEEKSVARSDELNYENLILKISAAGSIPPLQSGGCSGNFDSGLSGVFWIHVDIMDKAVKTAAPGSQGTVATKKPRRPRPGSVRYRTLPRAGTRRPQGV